MLDPAHRSVYTTDIFPPNGMRLERALATTFSLDPILLLGIPLCLSGLDTKAKVGQLDRVAIWDRLERYKESIRVFVQSGGVSDVPRGDVSLISFLEKMVVEKNAPGGGSFHPKIWALKFRSDQNQETAYRLLVMSRNLTFSNDWDFSLRLDSIREADCNKKKEKPDWNEFNANLCGFMHRVLDPKYSRSQRKDTDSEEEKQKAAAEAEIWEKFVEEFRGVRWELPEGCEDLKFHYHGYDAESAWKISSIPEGSKILVVSPFCTQSVVEKLGKRAGKKSMNNPALVSRTDEMDKIARTEPGQKIFNDFFSVQNEQGTENPSFSNCFYLRSEYFEDEDNADDEDSKDQSVKRTRGELHAKIFMHEKGGKTHLVMGSANATSAAMPLNESAVTRNVEILVDILLSGKTGKKMIERQFSAAGENNEEGAEKASSKKVFGNLLERYTPADKRTPEEKEIEKATEQLEKLRNEIIKKSSGFHLVCGEQENEKWPLRLIMNMDGPNISVPDEVESVCVFPFTRKEEISIVCQENGNRVLTKEISLGVFPAKLLSTFIVFKLVSQHEKAPPLVFTLNIHAENLPEPERLQAIRRDIFSKWEAFLQYCSLMFDEDHYSPVFSEDAMARNGSSRSTAWTRSFEDLPVLETLIRFVNEDSAALQERLKRIHQAAESALENSSSHEVFFKDSEKTDQARKKALKNMEDMKILCRTFLEAIKLTNE